MQADVPTRPAVRAAGAALALPVARCLAWALLLSGWLVLGVLGRRHWPLWAGGQAALALWLLSVGLGLAWMRQRAAFSGRQLQAVLLGSTAVLVLGLGALQTTGQRGWLAVLALAWAALLVAASAVVKARREAARLTPPAPLRPALAGGLLAALACAPLLQAGGAGQPWGLLVALALAGLWLARAVPAARTDLRVCRAGLFDCAWPVPDAAAWRQAWRAPWQLPRLLALMGMLPMMVGLGPMAEACAGEWGLPLAASAGLHLAAMLLPATLWRAGLAAAHPHRLGLRLLLLMLAAAALALALPGVSGWMAASLLLATAWSLAWAAPLLTRHVRPAPLAAVGTVPPSAWRVGTARATGAAITAAVALALGTAQHAFGPAAATAVAPALALATLVAMAAAAWRGRSLAARPPGQRA